MASDYRLDEFASLVGSDDSWIEQYRAVGLLDLDEDGFFERQDVLRVQLIRIREEAGESSESIVKSLRSADDLITDRLFRRPGEFYSLQEAPRRLALPQNS